jgi:glutathione S-transferase
VKWTAEHLGLPFEWIETDVLKSETRTAGIPGDEPGRAGAGGDLRGRPGLGPVQRHHAASGRGLGADPGDPIDRAKMYEWLFWEQYSHEPYVAVARFQVIYLGKSGRSWTPSWSSAAPAPWRVWKHS